MSKLLSLAISLLIIGCQSQPHKYQIGDCFQDDHYHYVVTDIQGNDYVIKYWDFEYPKVNGVYDYGAHVVPVFGTGYSNIRVADDHAISEACDEPGHKRD